MTTYIFFDIDGTLTNDISSWKTIHDSIGSREEAKNGHKQWLKHNDARLWVDHDLGLLNKYRVTPDQIVSILRTDNIEYQHRAKDSIEDLKYLTRKLDVEIHLVTGAFGYYARAVQNDLDIEHLHYHRVHFSPVYDAHGTETMRWQQDMRYTFKDKGDVVSKYVGIGNRVITIGNGTNDIEMFKEADISIGTNIRKSDQKKIAPHLDIQFHNKDGVFPTYLIDTLMGLII